MHARGDNALLLDADVQAPAWTDLSRAGGSCWAAVRKGRNWFPEEARISRGFHIITGSSTNASLDNVKVTIREGNY